jgi:3-phosphoshikimate 1-carboxyvinyltransferase
MRVRVTPGAVVQGAARVPADKSIAHRWLFLATIARGTSHLAGLGRPLALDVASTEQACAALLGRDRLGEWGQATAVSHGQRPAHSDHAVLAVQGRARIEWWPPRAPLDCGNSGTSMRLLMGVIAASAGGAVLDGDDSLRARPMERVAEPLRRMGAGVETVAGHAPVTVKGAKLRGIRHESEVPSAQVKSAILLAGINATGRTEIVEPAPTRDHTERALRALGGPVIDLPGGIAVERFDVPAFAGTVPGDVSSAAFLAAAAVLTGGETTVEGIGCNPTRSAFLRVLFRMGAHVEVATTGEELGEPVGALRLSAHHGLQGVVVAAEDLPGIVDEVPVLAAVAAHAEGQTRFAGAGELRVKESDRLTGLRDLLRGLGGDASIEGDALVVAGGGLKGGTADSNGDHRMAMAAVVAALAAEGPSEIDGVEAAAVSFPGFTATMLDLGARIEVLG